MNVERSNPAPLDGSLLTGRQAAELLNISEGTLRMSRYRGRLFGLPAPSWVRIGSAIRYRRDELCRWLDKNTTEEPAARHA